MPVAVKGLVMDVAVTDFARQECEVLYSGPSHQPPPERSEDYKNNGTVVRLHLCLMGETQPVLSPLAVDIGTDREYRIYRYDWVLGIRGLAGGNWKGKLRREALVVQAAMKPGVPNIGCTCAAATLNVLPPSRDTSTWSERNGDALVGFMKGTVDFAAKTAGIPADGATTKVAAALSNSLASRKRRKSNWYMYQYLDLAHQAVEWRIRRGVLDEYGPLLRGSLMLAFHGGACDGEAEDGGICLQVRPLLSFWRGLLHTQYFGDDLGRVNPMERLSENVELRIFPKEPTQANWLGYPI